MRKSLLGIFSLALITACGSASPDAPAGEGLKTPTPATAAKELGLSGSPVELARQTLLLTDQIHSELTALFGLDGHVALFADDITYTDGDNILHGRQAARDYLTALQYPAPAGYTTRWQTVRGDVSANGLDGYTFGWMTFTAPDGTIYELHGKYIAYWRLGPLGWRVVARLEVQTYSSPTPPPSWFKPVTGGKPSLPLVDVNAARASLVAADQAFSALSVSQGQAVAFPAYVALEGVNIGGPMTYGRDAIVERYAAVPITNVLSWTSETADVSRVGDFGFSVGPWSWTDGQSNYRGVYMSVWQKESGEWKWIVDG